MKTLLEFARRHIIVFCATKLVIGLVIGFGLGVYYLPIITAEKGLSASELLVLKADTQAQIKTGEFVKDAPGSDRFHWGEGMIYVTPERIWLEGKVAPGPDYRLYLTKGHILTKAAFLKVKDQSLQVAPVKGFENFSLPVPSGLNIAGYDGVVIWCERFGAFITSASIN